VPLHWPESWFAILCSFDHKLGVLTVQSLSESLPSDRDLDILAFLQHYVISVLNLPQLQQLLHTDAAECLRVSNEIKAHVRRAKRSLTEYLRHRKPAALMEFRDECKQALEEYEDLQVYLNLDIAHWQEVIAKARLTTPQEIYGQQFIEVAERPTGTAPTEVRRGHIQITAGAGKSDSLAGYLLPARKTASR